VKWPILAFAISAIIFLFADTHLTHAGDGTVVYLPDVQVIGGTTSTPSLTPSPGRALTPSSTPTVGGTRFATPTSSMTPTPRPRATETDTPTMTPTPPVVCDGPYPSHVSLPAGAQASANAGYLNHLSWLNMTVDSVRPSGDGVDIQVNDHLGTHVYGPVFFTSGNTSTFYPPYDDVYTIWFTNPYISQGITFDFSFTRCRWVVS